MDQRKQANRLCICIIGWAIAVRLLDSGFPEFLLNRLNEWNIAPFLIYLETGRDVRFSASEAVFSDHFRESPPPQVFSAEMPEETEPALPVFSRQDAATIDLSRGTTQQPDPEKLLTASLDWCLTGDTPSVLILHTHTTESYTQNAEPYVETSDYRTLDEHYNMLSIGDRVKERLEAAGIRVIHDRTIHDYPSYNGSYAHARKETSRLLQEYPGIRLVLDLHRDASGSPGNQLRTEVLADGIACAQLMMVVGTGTGGLVHEHWQENLSLALKFHALLERQTPGIMRPVNLRSQRFNQDLSPGCLLVEVGAAGNSHEEALLAAEKLAQAVILLARGTAPAAPE